MPLSGPITFSGGDLLPPTLTDLRFEAGVTVYQLNSIFGPNGPSFRSYDFDGPFQLTATLVPEPCIALLLGGGLLALARRARAGANAGAAS